ncbi:MAG: hypothetical protein K9M97_01125 [Akkermansiaceae bacterium]|nr:hypothetical protein [Akkermansiaceae bacterium]
MPDPAAIIGMANAFCASQVLFASCDLGIFDFLSRSPIGLSAAIRYNRDVYQAWGRLPELVRSGKPVENPEIHLGEDPDRTRDFVLAMHGRALGSDRSLVPQLKLKGRCRLLAPGGGGGTCFALIARHHPQLSCTVIDLPGVLAVAEELIAEQGAGERARTIAGVLAPVA